MPRYFRHYYSFSLERLNGTEYAAISMTRTGNRLTTADVSEWDGDDEMEHAFVLLCTGIASVVSGAYPFHFWLKRSAKLPSSSAPRGLRRSASNFSRKRANWRLVSRVNSPCSIQEK